MKKNVIKSQCMTPTPTVIKRRSIMLGRQIRQGLVDGVSDDCSQLLRNCFDKDHGVVDPYFSFGNEVIGVDKFQRAVLTSRAKLEEQTKQNVPVIETTQPSASNPQTPATE